MIDPEIQRAAEQGDAEAQCRLGDIYYQGSDEFPRDAKKAVYWYRMAAEQGNAGAQFSLGGMYREGEGVPRNEAEAVKWFQQAAEQGHAAAQYACNYAVIRFLPCAESGEFVNIGVVLSCPRTGYFNVRLEQQQFSRISNLFPEIQRREIQRAIECFGKEMERVCVKVGSHSDAQEQLPRKQELSRHFFSEVVRPRESVVRCSEPRTAMAEKPEALLDALFERYVERLHAQEELGRNKDTEDEGEEERRSRIAAEQGKIQRAAEQGDAAAQCRLGDIYSIGYGVPCDGEKAVYWYRKAAEQGSAGAQCSLGWMYKRGLGVPKDLSEAAEWYRKAADQGHSVAIESLREVWLRMAAEQGHTAAQYSLGRMYRFGLGVAKDDVEAEKWFREASKHRCIASKVLLSAMEREKSARNEDAVEEGEEESQTRRRQKL